MRPLCSKSYMVWLLKLYKSDSLRWTKVLYGRYYLVGSISTHHCKWGGYFPSSILPVISAVTPSISLSNFFELSLSDVPTESQPSTSPLISSLSLSSSEENIGKKLLRKLSEWAICLEHRCNSTPTHTVRCAQTFSVRHSNSAGCILATGDVSYPSLYPTLSCWADSPDTTVLVGSDTIWLSYFYLFIWVGVCAA